MSDEANGQAAIYLTRHELAARTGLSPATIQRLKAAGRIPFHQPGGPGGRVVFPADAIEQTRHAAEAAGENRADAADVDRPLAGPRPAWQQRKVSPRS